MFILVNEKHQFDADIILKTLFDTAANILFICYVEEKDKPLLVSEFWNLPALIDETRVFGLNPEMDEAERKRLQQKWSFAGIMESLEGRIVDGEPFRGMTAYLYVSCSHFADANNVALYLLADWGSRPPDELELLDVSHSSRILCDHVTLAWICAYALCGHFKGEFSDTPRFYAVYERVSTLSEPLQAAFDHDLRELYRKMFRGPPNWSNSSKSVLGSCVRIA
ncbi:hypothetical protein [Mesorhizobium sp. L-8-3]|uniref:hypothetical protein n=1 Tax=Mesorhizobium sp. L-8-3 TaxID=2744522 RepID=UPI001925EED1|nr:hypothetical protein [Mesorhizobium sp. L-8-3]BCH24106.1 hypothetical protein MesoLjLb_38910 [Mesorhizobium sp. L-8-3]